ncbi:homocysteine S-methyltransferase family protein [Salisediminibacterium beveridgei]|uniref:Bifunctional homocysteine S-methyltransferase/5,10-methylenetetrahydrofolate reductase n=1 Tax=Salisediminibacterium beveridgei TaxID=632773 RepID=A0A1D7QX05_9BACI|nr:homocysteine S-methyltransferase family protein [Salisediminibacterium beveridgei]AOM83509.1 Bifunctional homocysteine S-methyltransferase/5,10-methylenetetrahydrofolate reductase [Salisediminibacterium beveridgei]
MANTKRSLEERLNEGTVIVGEGYLFEMERRGYLQAGSFVPEVALEHPDVLKQVYRDYMNCGSDVVLAFTYNAHREKMRIIGKEELLEPLNRNAIRLAKEVAKEHPTEEALVAGNISNTNIFDPEDPASKDQVRAMFAEMIQWSKEEGVDFINGETFYYHEEAVIALEEIQKQDLPAVITLGLMAENKMREGMSVEESCRILSEKGALVVGMNCFRGPDTMQPYLKKIREAVDGFVGGLPIPYRTTEEHPTFFNLPDGGCSCSLPTETTFPTSLDPLYHNRYELAAWAKEAQELGVNYIGLCCGASPAMIRAIAEATGNTTINSKYSPNMEKHFLFGKDESLKTHNQDYRTKA